VVRALLGREWVSTTEVEKATGYPNKTTRRTLEDLHAHNLVERQLGGKGEAHKWKLATEPTEQLAENDDLDREVG
jgi:DNA-binding IclR family transcriptional regulator